MSDKQSKSLFPLLKKWMASPVKQIVSVASGRILSSTHLDCSDSPNFNRQKWSSLYERTNNCYNYAINQREKTVYEPGYIAYSQGRLRKKDLEILHMENFFSNPFEDVCQKIKRLAEADGLIWLGHEPKTQPGYYIIALAMADHHRIWGARDYHWYRLDKDHNWSHKQGEYPVERVKKSLFSLNADDVTMPHELKNKRYANFMGYYLVPNKPFKINRKKVTELQQYLKRKAPKRKAF